MNRDEARALGRALDEQELEPEEFDRRLREALADEREGEERASLIRWFTTRYPTVRDRLAYARRKYRQLMQSPLGS